VPRSADVQRLKFSRSDRMREVAVHQGVLDHERVWKFLAKIESHASEAFNELFLHG
jgi:hypothetical protein